MPLPARVATGNVAPLPMSLDTLQDMAERLARSDLVPKDFHDRPENCLLAIIAGQSVGLDPFQSMRSIAVVGNRPTLWGDALLALVLASPLCESVQMFYDEADGGAGVCRVKRRGQAWSETRFTLEEARQAGLLDNPKKDTWQKYRKRMLQLRARAFALRDNFADLLMGLNVRELEEGPAQEAGGVEDVMPPCDRAAAEKLVAVPEADRALESQYTSLIGNAGSPDELDSIASSLRGESLDAAVHERLLKQWTDKKRGLLRG